MTSTRFRSRVDVHVENVGGIDETALAFEPGVTVLAGRNATNRTSFLQAVAAALGGDYGSLKAGANRGKVTLTVEGETYTREFERNGSTVAVGGDPYLEDTTAVELFAFLFESNAARRGVERGDDLRALLMEPIDTEEIRAEIDRLQDERRRLDERLDELDALQARLPELEAERTALTEQLEAKRDELAEVTDEIDALDADVDAPSAEREELDERLAALNEARTELGRVQSRLESERESLESLREERSEVETDLENLDEPDESERDDVDARLDRLRDRKQSFESAANRIQRVVQFNREVLDGAEEGLLRTADETDSAELTAQLVEDSEEVVCWTCGSSVERNAIEETLSELRDLQRDFLDRRDGVTEEISELKERKDRLDEMATRRREFEARLEDIDAEIADCDRTIDDLRDRREELQSEVEQLDAEIDELQSEQYTRSLELHREATQLEFEIDRIETDRRDVEEQIESAEAQLDERADLRARREQVQTDIEERRTEVERIEDEAVASFNDHMDDILSILEYDNIERVWIERRAENGEDAFHLHVVRSTADGATFEDTVDHLSESEREVVGLVFALAGYLVHDVHETVPFMLLDSLEAIDPGRLATLVDYFGEYAPYLVVAVLPDEAAAIDESYPQVTPA